MMNCDRTVAHTGLIALLQDERETALFTAEMIYRIYGFNQPPAKHHLFITYLTRVYRITQIPHTVILIALKYMQRILPMVVTHDTRPTSFTGLFTSVLILANHFLDDHAYTNRTWSKVTGIHHQMINTTQRQLMALLDHRLHVPPVEYDTFTQWLLQQWTGRNIPVPLSSSLPRVGQKKLHHGSQAETLAPLPSPTFSTISTTTTPYG